jgi:tetratricopeptide (TPR) repeat protein
VLSLQRRFPEALAAFDEARCQFLSLNEPSMVSLALFQIGNVYLQTAQPDAAQDSYQQALAIDVRIGDRSGQAGNIMQLADLHASLLHRLEDAESFYQRAIEIYVAIGDPSREGMALTKLSNILRQLHRYEEARAAITRAIQRKEAFGHAAMPWTSWQILAAIETEAGNPSAAADSRQKAREAYLAYRRDGGGNQSGSGRLALAIRQALAAGSPAEAASLLQQLAADPGWVNGLPYLTALQAITAGSRERSLADDPRLSYDQAAEVLLLIEALEAGAGGEAIA